MFATTASISGDITSDSATLGKFSLDSTSIIASGSRMVLDAENYRIQLLDDQFTPLVNINAGSSLVTPTAGSTVTETYNMVASTLSQNASSGTVQVSSTDYPDENSGDTFTISTAGTTSYIINYSGGSTSTYSRAIGQGSSAQQYIYLEIHGNSDFSSDLQHTIYISGITAYGYDISGGEGLEEEFSAPSVVGDTEILMADGSIKKAKDIKVNENITAWDDDNKLYNIISEISQIKTRLVDKIYRVTTESGKSVDVSEPHGFYISMEEEIYAYELVEGESKIFVKHGNEAKLELVTSVEIIFGEHQVYTFSVPGLFNYISNDIISHNTSTGPQTSTNYLSTTTSRSGTLTMTSGTKYYRIKRLYYARAQAQSSDNSTRSYTIRTEFDFTAYFTPLTQGTEINNAGLQVNKSDTKVFRVDMSSTTDSAQTPIATLVGGIRMDYFQPYYSTADGGLTDKTYGSSNYNSNINYSERSYPLTRAMCKLTLNSSSEYSGYSDTLSPDDPHINVTSITRTSNSNSAGGNTDRNQYFTVSLDNTLTGGKAVPMLSCFGRAGDSNSYNASTAYYDAETASDISVQTYSTQFRWHFRDNDTGNNRDPYEIYFVVFG